MWFLCSLIMIPRLGQYFDMIFFLLNWQIYSYNILGFWKQNGSVLHVMAQTVKADLNVVIRAVPVITVETARSCAYFFESICWDVCNFLELVRKNNLIFWERLSVIPILSQSRWEKPSLFCLFQHPFYSLLWLPCCPFVVILFENWQNRFCSTSIVTESEATACLQEQSTVRGKWHNCCRHG